MTKITNTDRVLTSFAGDNATVAELAKATDLSPKQVYSAIQSLLKKGAIETKGKSSEGMMFGPVSSSHQADAGLEGLGRFGLGESEETAKCPHCGSNHCQNGVLTADDNEANSNKTYRETGGMANEFECMGCGGGWGAPVVPVAPKAKGPARGAREKGGERQGRSTMAANLKAEKRFAGKQFWAIAKGNPRKAGTDGAAAYAWLVANPGATAEEIAKAGCFMQHIAWDLKLGNVSIEAPKAKAKK